MNYLKYDVGHLARGQAVAVRLRGNAANVLLLTSSAFNAFQRGHRFEYVGGLAKRSPVTLRAKQAGRHVVVVYPPPGTRARVQASAQVLPAPLPTVRTTSSPGAAPVRQVAENLDELIAESPRAFDVFISHASEDKEDLVRPLAEALRDAGLEVWYDEFELKLGMSLRRSIDGGISQARFGLVVLSEAFFAKGWPQYELDGMVTAQVSGKQILLPLWHGLSRDDVMAKSPSLADKVALVTGGRTIDSMVDEIVDAIQHRRREDDAA